MRRSGSAWLQPAVYETETSLSFLDVLACKLSHVATTKVQEVNVYLRFPPSSGSFAGPATGKCGTRKMSGDFKTISADTTPHIKERKSLEPLKGPPQKKAVVEKN